MSVSGEIESVEKEIKDLLHRLELLRAVEKKENKQ